MKTIAFERPEDVLKLYQISLKPSKRYFLLNCVLFIALFYPTFFLLNIIYPATKTIDLTLSVWTVFILLAIGLSMIWMIIHIFIFRFIIGKGIGERLGMDSSLIGFDIEYAYQIKRWFFISAFFATILLTFIPVLLLMLLFWPLNDVIFIFYMSFIIYLVNFSKLFWFFLRVVHFRNVLFKVSHNYLIAFITKF
ncbi:MAG: hypothetical protein WC278_00660 [Bacilli bacterium]